MKQIILSMETFNIIPEGKGTALWKPVARTMFHYFSVCIIAASQMSSLNLNKKYESIFDNR